MKRSIKIMLYCAGLTALTSTIAIACGPYFPWQLLDNRKETLLNLPAIDSFSQKVKTLGVVTAEEKKNLYSATNLNNPYIGQTTCPNTDEAYKKAAILFHNKQWEDAYSAFSMLAYNSNPAQQVCAKYTLGRIEKELGHFEDAVQSFNSTAYLVAHGAPDPLHLGIAAYGEAAGVILDQIGMRSIDKDDVVYWQVGSIKEDSFLQLQRAVELYLKQATLGDNDGVSSVMIILQGLSDPNNLNARELLKQAVQNSLLRKLLLAYVLTDEIDYKVYSKAKIQNILQAFIQTGLDPKNNYDDMGSLAAFAYQNNDVDKAQAFAEYDWNRNQKALDAWILAKIALRKGEKKKAQDYYHQAISHFNDETLQTRSKQRVQGERAVLTLSQGNFVQALEELWPVRDIYWGDIVYLAENVLTPDELRQFVNSHTNVPKDSKAACNRDIEEDYVDQNAAETSDDEYNMRYSLNGRSMALRHLLAHRLMRVGRLQEAIPYFTQIGDANCKGTPQHVQIERSYIKATIDMHRSFWATDRAKAAWKAATILRRHGMELMGTDGYPDQNPGTYPQGIGQMIGPANDLNNEPWSVPAEQVRTGASWPIPNRRFHYRYLAVEDVLYAANLIPYQSQAYAALLCHANGWMQKTSYYDGVSMAKDTESPSSHMSLGAVNDPQFAYAKSRELYNLYLKNGAVVPFAKDFGYNCPQPKFGAVPKLKRDLFWKEVKKSLQSLRGH
ncbi:tetratricopeptide repeat protein [Commensalibacter communis]|uniref:tetratricopeptide repeat protein n=1 Tax=Commensalibacter communis TaxID=2972786 RepID=UPI0022FF8727|nr:hypothetical protein [Commensalibacter communis]CAI3950961.1 unnamed protein product [Commensalibacter communis]CAI3955548.1 unnamed protein product [Commensalibacter communis]